MSKAILLALANFNLFKNVNPEIEFSRSRDDRVMAQYSGYENKEGKTKYDVRGIKARGASGKGYIRLSISIIGGDGRKQFFNGALFRNDKRETVKQPDFQGSVNLDNQQDGPKLRMSAWKKSGPKAGDYLSVAIQEFLTREEAESRAAGGGGGDFDMGDVPATPAPAQRQAAAPARQSAPAAARAQTPVQAKAASAKQLAGAPMSGFDDMDADIPFFESSMSYDMTTSKARSMKRYGY